MSIFGGDSGSGGSSSLDQTFSDASLGDQIMGGDGSIFGSGSGAGDSFGGSLGQFAQAMAALGGGGGATTPAAAATLAAAASDPTAAQAVAMSPATAGGGAGGTGGTQSSTPAGDTTQAQPQQQQSEKPLPQDVLNQIRKALAQRQAAASGKANPYEPGGGEVDPIQNWENEGGAQGTPTPKPPWWKWAGGKPFTSPNPPSDDVIDIPPIPGISAPTRAQTAGEAAVDQAIGRNPAAQAAGEQAVAGATTPDVQPPRIEGLPAPGDPSMLMPPGVPGLRGAGLGGGLGAALKVMTPIPAETGTQPPGGTTLPWGSTFAGPVSEVQREGEGGPAPGPGASEVLRDGEGGPAPTDPKTGLPADPKTGKPLTPEQYKKKYDQTTKGRDITVKKKGEPLPTKTPPLPTKKGGPAPAPAAETPAPGSILHDVLGFTGSNPINLGQLAKLAMPLMMMALGGMGGRRGGGFGRFGHHGGGFGRFGGFRGGMNAMRGGGHGPLPAFRGGHLGPGYYPNRGGGFGYHPGGWHEGWDSHPNWGGGGQSQGGGGVDPSILTALLGGGQGQQGGSGQGGGVPAGVNPFQPGGGADPGSVNASGVASSSNPFLSTLLAQESGGQNIVSRTDADDTGRTLAQGGNPNQISQGYFQIKPSTWRRYAAAAGVDPNMLPMKADYATQWKVASMIPVGQWGPATKRLLAGKFGAIDWNMPLGQVAARFGRTQVAAPKAPPVEPKPGTPQRFADDSEGGDTGAYSPSPLT